MSTYRNARMDNYNYWTDQRVVSSLSAKPKLSKCRGFLLYTIGEDEETGEPTTVRVPTTFCVCHMCRGRGVVTNPSIDAGGLTQEDFDEWSDSEVEGYFAGVRDMRD